VFRKWFGRNDDGYARSRCAWPCELRVDERVEECPQQVLAVHRQREECIVAVFNARR